MATNNHTEEEPRIATLERQVQTLAMAVERLTKQNHNLEEQLCQTDAGPNNHGEEQKGTNAERRGLWRVKGSIEPSGVIQNPHALTRCGEWD